MKKRIISVLLATVFALSVIGCGTKDTKEQDAYRQYGIAWRAESMKMRSRHFRMRLESRSDISGRKNWISVFTRQKHRHWTERQKMHLQRIMPLSNIIKMHAHTICVEIFIWIWEKKKRAGQILRVLCSKAKKIMKSTLESMSL